MPKTQLRTSYKQAIMNIDTLKKADISCSEKLKHINWLRNRISRFRRQDDISANQYTKLSNTLNEVLDSCL